MRGFHPKGYILSKEVPGGVGRHHTGVITPGNGSTASAPARIKDPDWTSVSLLRRLKCFSSDSLEKENT